ncbi:hypothetical protein [Amycolatopsis jiangsuensis]|uniref:Uncharacterized protein n=1 Tax=Amycolatopsis jiangsuensis TaxID=1181879 RepID=A0A840J740_9PSEU|nr:hypothetical protein [Amycolatopsis jiangsuensis]MBB4689830.1 hypothetical protein [Amycolatopsis jiangsuensis]
MSTTATYLDDLSRVRIAFDGFGTAVDSAFVERSIDGITWATVRGGDTVPVVAGAGHLDDYEFAAGVPNFYRVSGVDGGPILGVPDPGTPVTGTNVSLTPPLPAAVLDGDALLLLASIRNSGTGAPVAPAGWTRVLDLGNVALFSRVYDPSVAAPTVTFTGGTVGADTMAQIMAFHNADPMPVTTNTLVNASAQNVALAGVSVPEEQMMNLFLAWKQDDWTGAVGRGFAEIGDWSSTAGDDAAMWWEYTVQGDTDIDFTTATLTVTGGAAAISKSAALAFRRAAYVTRQTTTVTPVLDSAWIKNPQRPSLNRKVTVSGVSEITRPSRSGTFDVVGRTLPVAISDVQGSRRYTLTVMTRTLAEAADFDQAFASGLPVFLQAPELDAVVPTLYASVGEVTLRRGQSVRAPRRYFDLPLTECAAPASTVYGNTYTWADVVADYPSWSDVLENVATWSNLIDLVSDNEVVVP